MDRDGREGEGSLEELRGPHPSTRRALSGFILGTSASEGLRVARKEKRGRKAETRNRQGRGEGVTGTQPRGTTGGMRDKRARHHDSTMKGEKGVMHTAHISGVNSKQAL